MPYEVTKVLHFITNINGTGWTSSIKFIENTNHVFLGISTSTTVLNQID